MFSRSKEKEPRYLCLSEAKASHSHKIYTEFSSSVPHFLQRQWQTQHRMNLCIALSVVRVLLQQYASNGNEQNNHKSGFGWPTKQPLENVCLLIRNNRLREKGKKNHRILQKATQVNLVRFQAKSTTYLFLLISYYYYCLLSSWLRTHSWNIDSVHVEFYWTWHQSFASSPYLQFLVYRK